MPGRSYYVRESAETRGVTKRTFRFLCFATKAVHLELVSDFTSEAFITAFKWFISCRSRLVHMYSDNGTLIRITPLRGRHRQIQELYNIYNDQQVQSEIKDFLRELEIWWIMHPILEVYGR